MCCFWVAELLQLQQGVLYLILLLQLLLLHLYEVPTHRGGHPAALDHRQGAGAAQHPSGADHPVHGHEPAAGRVDAALVLRRGAA